MENNAISVVLTTCAVGCAFLCDASDAAITQLSQLPVEQAFAEVVNDVVFVSVAGDDAGVWAVDGQGQAEFFADPNLRPDQLAAVSRVRSDSTGVAWAGVTYYSDDFFLNPVASAVYAVEAATVLQQWSGRYNIAGLKADLTALGTLRSDFGNSPVALGTDGSVEVLGAPGGDAEAGISYVLEDGSSAGNAQPPGTLGTAPAKWTQGGDFSFIDLSGSSVFTAFLDSARSRSDGAGVNLAMQGDTNYVRYGDSAEWQRLLPHAGDIFGELIVTETDFVLNSTGTSAYYRGVAEIPGQTVPLVDVLPGLASIEIDEVLDATSNNGLIHVVFASPDGLFVLSAPDPLVVPEPATCVCVLLLVAGMSARTRN